MTALLVYVDFENKPGLKVPELPPEAQLFLFRGPNQKNVPAELVDQLQPLGKSVKWIPTRAPGKNALDFHIAYYIGRHALEFPGARVLIVSDDKGFDPLVTHLKAGGISASRGKAIPAAHTTKPTAAKPAAASKPTVAKETSAASPADLVMASLKKMLKNKPQKREKLEKHVLSTIKDCKNPAAVVQQLVEAGSIRIAASGKVEYPGLADS